MLKLFAALFMLIDHIGYFFSAYLSETTYFVLRSIGRLAFPIYAYYLAIGFRRTKNIVRYFLRLLIFAIGTEYVFRVAYRLAGRIQPGANVLFTFIGALAFLTGLQWFFLASRDVVGRLELLPNGDCAHRDDRLYQLRMSRFGLSMPTWLGRIIGSLIMALSLFFVEWIHADYGAYGVLYVLVFYLATTERLETRQLRMERAFTLATILNIAAYVIYNFVLNDALSELQFLSLFAIPLIFSLKLPETKPSVWWRYFFYVFYPLHVITLSLIVMWLRR